MFDMAAFGKRVARAKDLLKGRLETATKTLANLESELVSLDRVVDALGGRGASTRGGRRGGKWRPGRPGRPPRWWIEQQQKKGKAAERPVKRRKRRKATPKMLAALVKARAARAAKLAAAK